MIQKSPSGSYCPYYYKGGELQPLHYGSYHNNFERLSQVIDAEEAFILKSHGGRKVWIDLYETDKTDAFYEKLTTHICTIGHKILKLAICGFNRREQRIINKMLLQKGCGLTIRYFDDPEISKDWLVGAIT